MDVDDGWCTAMRMYLMLLNCIPKIGSNDKLFVVYFTTKPDIIGKVVVNALNLRGNLQGFSMASPPIGSSPTPGKGAPRSGWGLSQEQQVLLHRKAAPSGPELVTSLVGLMVQFLTMGEAMPRPSDWPSSQGVVRGWGLLVERFVSAPQAQAREPQWCPTLFYAACRLQRLGALRPGPACGRRSSLPLPHVPPSPLCPLPIWPPPPL